MIVFSGYVHPISIHRFFCCNYKKWWITCISFLTHLHHFQLRNVGSFSSLHMIQSNTSEPKKITQPNPRPKKNQRCFCKNMMTCNTANTAKTWLCIFVATIANGKFHQGNSQTMLSHGLCCVQPIFTSNIVMTNKLKQTWHVPCLMDTTNHVFIGGSNQKPARTANAKRYSLHRTNPSTMPTVLKTSLFFLLDRPFCSAMFCLLQYVPTHGFECI